MQTGIGFMDTGFRTMLYIIRRYFYVVVLLSLLSFMWLVHLISNSTGHVSYNRLTRASKLEWNSLSNSDISSIIRKHTTAMRGYSSWPNRVQSNHISTGHNTTQSTHTAETNVSSDEKGISAINESFLSKDIIETIEKYENISADRGVITNNDDQILEEIYKKLKLYYDHHVDPVGIRTRVYHTFYRPRRNQGKVNCTAIMNNNHSEIAKSKYIMTRVPRRIIDPVKYSRTKDCANFKRRRGYINHPLSEMEFRFPLAFGIVVYKEPEQVERLLRTIYRPHNYYCLHVDMKTSETDRAAFESIARCLDNVFIASTSIDVQWGKFSVLEAELACMRDLWQYTSWKYYINLTGQEFPLKTNRHIVKILRAMDGANLVDGSGVRISFKAVKKYLSRWTRAKRPPPHSIRPIKGSVHVAVNRAFVNFSLNDQRSKDFLDWLKLTSVPDETFFASLNHNPHLGIPGSFIGEPEEYPLTLPRYSSMRYKTWDVDHSVFGCDGKYVRQICIFGVGDLHKAYADVGLFANKFHLDYQYLALDCLEEVLYELTWQQYLTDVNIDVTYYEKLDFRTNHL